MNLNVLSFVSGVFFFISTMILSIVLYRKSTHRKTLTFTYITTSLYTRRHPEITIAFKGKQIENLSRLRVVVWNSGNQEIRSTDIPAGSEPSITLTGAKLRSIVILDTSPVIDCTAEEHDEQTVHIGFQFLNPGDYAALEVLYESEDQTPKIEYSARIIGGESDSRRFLQPTTPLSWIGPVWIGLVLLVTAFFWLWTANISFSRAPHHWVGVKIGDISGFIFAFVSFLIFGLAGWFKTKEYVSRRRLSHFPLAARRVFK